MEEEGRGGGSKETDGRDWRKEGKARVEEEGRDEESGGERKG